MKERMVQIVLKFGTKLLKFKFKGGNSYEELQKKIYSLTKVKPEKQKVFGFDIVITDKNLPISNFIDSKLKKNKKGKKIKLRLIGTIEEEVFVDKEYVKKIFQFFQKIVRDDPDVINDLDYDPNNFMYDDANFALLQKKIKSTKINFINPLRGKRLVVLDIDMTIFDCKNMRDTKYSMEVLKRPYLEIFLKMIYDAGYDICFWSQTRWVWIEAKLNEMNLFKSKNYKISFILEKASMFKIDNKKNGKKHWVKPLAIIWDKCKDFNAKNTVHVDDLARNFVCNPENGIKIKRYKKKNTKTDNELLLLAEYLILLKDKEDFSKYDNLNWKNALEKLRNENK